MHIYYFSGTGNSFYAAKKIAQHFEATLLPITSLKDISDDMVGFVLPSYDFKIPKIVSEILKKSNIQANYIFAVSTYGVALYKNLLNFNKLLRSKGLVLSAGFGLHMPHNAVGSSSFCPKKIDTILEASEIKIEYIIESIEHKDNTLEKTHIFEKGHLIKLFPKLMHFLYLLLKGPQKLRFKINQDCIGCHLCQSLCPADNIEIINGIPTFKDQCSSCFACLQWCPKQAIQFGDYHFKDLHLRHYTHPKVTSSELLDAKSSS